MESLSYLSDFSFLLTTFCLYFYVWVWDSIGKNILTWMNPLARNHYKTSTEMKKRRKNASVHFRGEQDACQQERD